MNKKSPPRDKSIPKSSDSWESDPLHDFGPPTEEIVVSSGDPKSTPAASVVDEHGWAGDPTPRSTQAQQSQKRKQARSRESGPWTIEFILNLVATPENRLRRIFLKSKLHKSLRHRSRGYQWLYEELSLASEITKLHGGPTTPKHKLFHFLRTNVLFTIVVLVGVPWIGIQIGSVLLDNSPSIRTTQKAPSVQSRKVSKLSVEEREELKTTTLSILGHCSVTPVAREYFTDLLSKEEFFTNPNFKVAAEELQRFQEIYTGVDLPRQVRSAENRRKVISDLTSPILSEIDGYLIQQRRYLDKRKALLEEKEKEVKNNRGRANAQNITAINKSIALRNSLQALRKEMATSPGPGDLKRLKQAVKLLRWEIDSIRTLQSTSAIDSTESVWIPNLHTTSPEQLRDLIRVRLDKELVRPIRTNLTSFSGLTVFRMQVMTDTLNQVRRALRDLSHHPAQLSQQLGINQGTTNRRVNNIFGTDSRQWVDMEICNAGR